MPARGEASRVVAVGLHGRGGTDSGSAAEVQALRTSDRSVEVSEPLGRRQKAVRGVATPTCSQTDLLLKCQWWAADDLVLPGSTGDREAANWGSGYHAAIASALEFPLASGPNAAAVREARERFAVEDATAFDTACAVGFRELTRWLREGPLGINFLAKSTRREIERSYAWHVPTDNVRRCASPDPVTHVYPDRKPDEFCGTADLVISGRAGKTRRYLLIVDYKTGSQGSLSRPDKLKQLTSLAIGAGGLKPSRNDRGYFYDEIHLAILHHPREAPTSATVYAHTITPLELDGDSQEIAGAFMNRNEGYLRPGSHCLEGFCNAFSVCPSNRNALVELRRKAGPLLSPEDVGAAHQQLQAFRATFRRLDDAADTEIRAAVERFGPCPRPDGSSTILRESTPRKSLSLASIERRHKEAVSTGDGKLVHEILRLREGLEKTGCVEEITPKPALTTGS